MRYQSPVSRRDFIRLSATGALLSHPGRLLAQEPLPTRRIPATGEEIPIVGFGSTKAVLEIPEEGIEAIDNVIRMLLQYGGRVVDTSPRPEEVDRPFGSVLQDPDLRDRLFIAAKIYVEGEQNGIDQMRQNQRLFGRQTLDLVQVESLRDLETHWPNLRAWKDSGEARYIGATVFLDQDHEALEAFMRRESPDFVHLNYSVAETRAEQRLLPLAQERGMAALINRPFMNGTFFQAVANRPLPEWAAEFDCETWAQFSLKYLLAHPAVTCVLTETTNPLHMEENIAAGLGRLPDEATRRRMREVIGQL
ncbi:MAG: aldo/keto reductase [Gemmatimonas sp.]|nr:aldo/keto reductase [Gemmatimonas sp.]